MSLDLTQRQSASEVYKMFLDAWVLAGGDPARVYFPDVGHGELQSTDEAGASSPAPWARVQVSHNWRRQTSFGGPGGGKFTSNCSMIAEIYVRRGDGLVKSREMSEIVLKAFEGEKSPSGIWFRNVRPDERPPNGAWSQVNIIADFQYDRVK